MTPVSSVKRLGLTAFAAGTALSLCGPVSAADVTYQRLLNAKLEPQNWLMRAGSYDLHNTSALNQINRNNVANLKVKFMASIAGDTINVRQYFTPVVNDGALYVGNGWHQYRKYDIRGEQPQLVWTFDAEDDKAQSAAGGVIGSGLLSVGLFGKNMYVTPSYPPRLMAVDTESGKTVFDVSTKLPDVLPDQRHTASPVIVKDLVLVGNARGDGGNRGYMSAYSADKGELKWRFIMVPGPGEPGHDTWPEHAWETGGAAVWTEPSYDPETNMIYIGTGNPVPYQDPQWRAGDNLYTNSIVALDVDTGRLRWFFQETPNESWDYDAVAAKILLDVPGQGKVVSTASRDGFFYTWDRASGVFLSAQPWTPVTWTRGLDPKTGKPLEYIAGGKALQEYGGKAIKYNERETTARNVCPHHGGAPTFFPGTYDAGRSTYYFMSAVGCGDYFNTRPGNVQTRTLGLGANTRPALPHGALFGIDVRTGKVAKETRMQYPPYSGVLGTAGDLLFMTHRTGRVSAYDKDTLTELWGFDTGTSTAVNPMTYMVNGKQYVALTIGGGVTVNAWPELNKLGRSPMLVVFGL
jgi:alcohol dehydrogenase (cytochrome c)